jgi:hypothetical protein
VGDFVGARLGDWLGLGVGEATVYVGTSVGEAVGAALGEADGMGVGEPGVYAGARVGASVGALLGEEDGSGVGEPRLTKVADKLPDEVVALLSVTTPVVVSTAVTTVPEEKPVPDTESPTAIELTTDVDTVTVSEPDTDKPVVFTVCAMVYVGVSVGSTVGASVGEAEGFGVGLPGVYVGASVGTSVGSAEGAVVASGVVRVSETELPVVRIGELRVTIES